MVTIKTGDLLNATEDIIAHQVNCHGVAGGLAAVIFDKFPDADNDYRHMTQRAKPGDLLGIAQMTGQQRNGQIICNLYGQYNPGADYRPYALATALEMLGGFARNRGASVALPYKLSCGICGGDWDEVLEIIKTAMRGVKCTIYQREGDV